MKKLLLIKTHSIVDVITNSSSELFVCDTDKSIGFIKDALIDLLRQFGESNTPTIPLKFEDCFGDVYVLTEENVDEFIQEYLIGWSYGLSEYEDLGIPVLISWHNYEDVFEDDTGRAEKYPWHEHKIHNEKFENDCEAAHKEYTDAWLTEHGPTIRKLLIGRIIIEGESDNSIPYELWDKINEMFNGINYHLG